MRFMEKPKYNHRVVEKKWQKFWKQNQTFKTEIDYSKPKYYVLDMFPYPSGSGLHVGHVTGYTATDIVARYKRQKGFNVLHPMGWDSFGLPAEQYAIRTGTHPATATKANIDNFRLQLHALGCSYDWDREIATSDPAYYKWTQWIFTKLYAMGLAYEAETLVNYCPALGTALANEEIENGKSKEGGYPIERRPLKQWILKITAYAERLLSDLEGLDWPEGLKRLQINWIGKSEGAEAKFLIKGLEKSLQVFTTCPHTLFGATYIVLAPEHPLIDQITTPECKESVLAYKRATASKGDLERTELNKEKTGAWTGSYAINPVNGAQIPIWISDYVLMNYGTGAIMAVPAHDQRDFEFASKFRLPIIPVISPDIDNQLHLIPEEMTGEQLRTLVLDGKYCWIGSGKSINSKHADLSIDGLETEEAKKAVIEWLESHQLGKKTINYKLRDWLFSRQRYWGEPFPILHFEDGSQRILDLDELPLCPPEVKNYKPADGGLGPLASVKDWVEIIDPKTGKKAFRETNIMPQWAGSCWYYLRFCDPKNEERAWSNEAEKYWLPVDLYIGGAEHAVLHLLYARFWHKVLFDCGLVGTSEPFRSLRNQGLVIAKSYQKEGGGYVSPDDVYEKGGKCFETNSHQQLRSQIEKMSKSKLNGVSPDEIIDEYGADALRLYEMFMGPLEKEKIWSTEAVTGCRRFLNRFFDLTVSEKVTDESSNEALRLGFKLVKGVCNDIEALCFNTAIAKMMEFLNEFSKLSIYPKKVLKMAVQCLAPFAPHLAEELWQILGEKESITYVPYPDIDESYLEQESTIYVVQINGKVRGQFELSKDQTKEAILELVKQHPSISKHLGIELKKVIFVPNKLINLVY